MSVLSSSNGPDPLDIWMDEKSHCRTHFCAVKRHKGRQILLLMIPINV